MLWTLAAPQPRERDGFTLRADHWWEYLHLNGCAAVNHNSRWSSVLRAMTAVLQGFAFAPVTWGGGSREAYRPFISTRRTGFQYRNMIFDVPRSHLMIKIIESFWIIGLCC